MSFQTAQDLLPNPRASLAVPFVDTLNPKTPTGILQWRQLIGTINAGTDVLQILPSGHYDTIICSTFGINVSQQHSVRLIRGVAVPINGEAEVVTFADTLDRPRLSFADSREDVTIHNSFTVYVPLCNTPFFVRVDAADYGVYVTVTLLTLRGGYQK